MKNLILLFILVLTGVFNEAFCLNRLSVSRGYFWVVDTDRVFDLIIDEKFSPEYQGYIEQQVKQYFPRIEHVSHEPLRERTNSRGKFFVVKNSKDNSGYISLGSIGSFTSLDSNDYLRTRIFKATNPNMYVPEDKHIIQHELLHALGADHENNITTYTRISKRNAFTVNKAQKRRFRRAKGNTWSLYRSPAGASQLISYNKGQLSIGQEKILPSDQVTIDVLTGKFKGIRVSNNLLEAYNGADLHIVDHNTQVPVVSKYFKTYNDGYISAIGLDYMGAGSVESFIPLKPGKYTFYIKPAFIRNLNVPNALDNSGLEKPMKLGVLTITENGEAKQNKKLLDWGFEVEHINRKTKLLKLDSRYQEIHLPELEGKVVS